MVLTQVGDPRPVRLCRTIDEAVSCGPENLFRASQLLVIDHPPWSADFEILQGSLEHKPRRFKQPYSTHAPAPLVLEQIHAAQHDANRMFGRLYPTFKAGAGQHIMMRASWRPMISQDEPMHYDTYHGPNPLVTAYINCSTRPRVYAIGPGLAQLCIDYRKEMRELWRKKAEDTLHELRELGARGKGPLGQARKSALELAPGAIWFFNAKTLAHQLVYGEGAIGTSWEVPGAMEMPEDIFRRLL